ncbi:MAG TPA: glutamate--tRNA ligase, partial [Halothiobacillus sp.]
EHTALELRWHLGRLDIDPALNGPDPARIVVAYADRAHTLVEMAELAKPYYQDLHGYDAAALAKLDADAPGILAALGMALAAPEVWDEEGTLDHTVKQVAETLGFKLGKVGPLLRLALLGQTVSPSLGVTLSLFGQDKTLARLRALHGFLTA